MTEIQPLPDDEKDDVVFKIRGTVGMIQLNRPKKLNSLNGSMIRKIIPVLKRWETSDLVNCVVISGAGGKAFCAGGDVAALALQNIKDGPPGQRESTEYFAVEYKLNHLIATYTKPYIAIINGITMGGGMGLSCHAPFRIATEKTLFAMPETDIGLFPDVGGGFFLSRLDGGIGPYLAITSSRLRGIQAYYAGVATHYTKSSTIPDLVDQLVTVCAKSLTREMSCPERLKVLNAFLTQYSTSTPHDDPIQLAGELRLCIDEVFSLPTTVSQILDRLAAISEDGASSRPKLLRDWAAKTRRAIVEGKSPTSMAVTLRQLEFAQQWDIKETFKMEHIVAATFMRHPDFVQGVKSKLIDKPASKPTWDPPTAGEVPNGVVDKFFQRPTGLPALKLFDEEHRENYTQYPHAWTALPSETRIRELLKAVPMDDSPAQTLREIARQLGKDTGNIAGVYLKVMDVWSRVNMPRVAV
ncbi:uncharacterized protein PV06_01507 [Exophiala oligosperma]|nr:uncharacterized protein PV06_01507 [Exophiala oligosperma]KIW48951.1 hypothetical protein PV06_01507 [Exophiala oligosperma]